MRKKVAPKKPVDLKGKAHEPKKPGVKRVRKLASEGIEAERELLKLEHMEEETKEANHAYAHITKHGPTHEGARADHAVKEMEAARVQAEKMIMQHTTKVDEETNTAIEHIWKSKLPAREKARRLMQAKAVISNEERHMEAMEKGWLSKPVKKHLQDRENRLKGTIKKIDSELSKLKKAA